jgi:hypothetical protein
MFPLSRGVHGPAAQYTLTMSPDALIAAKPKAAVSKAPGKSIELNAPPMAAVSQWEREAIGERTRDALRHKRSSGERVGNIRFGFRLSPDGGHVEPDPGEQGVLTEIRHPASERTYVARDRSRPEPEGAAHSPWLRLAAGARGANRQAGRRNPVNPIRYSSVFFKAPSRPN